MSRNWRMMLVLPFLTWTGLIRSVELPTYEGGDVTELVL
jgi:hypothetical protein